MTSATYGTSDQTMSDPEVPEWSTLSLPDTRVDSPSDHPILGVFSILRLVFSKRRPVTLPEDLNGFRPLPKYLLQEFHSIPNGNYSKSLSAGYITGFDVLMLGSMRKARTRIASFFKGTDSVLDLGCAGGRTAKAIKAEGVADVWGLDASPYLLHHAAKLVPDVKFVQGLAEDTGFPSQRFDGVAACFLFHELPPKFGRLALLECHRILKDGGKLVICEPSPAQWKGSYWQMFREHGLKGVYFKLLASTVYEPFVALWHRTQIKSWLEEHGFELVSDEDDMPIRLISAVKRPAAA